MGERPLYLISYTDRRPDRIVGPERFAGRPAFQPVLNLRVGESAPAGRYHSAGYKQIKRVS